MARNGTRKPKKRRNEAAKSIKDLDRRVGHRIRARRMELHMSQQTLGDVLGVSFQQIQKYEKGINRIGASRLSEIARALDTDIGALFGNQTHDEYLTSPIGQFMLTRDGLDIAEAMLAISDAAKRRAVILMARSIADDKK